ncbi:uncharacterized protein LOC34619255 [Cyclospora cayetanensis]|uniref:Phosphodiesterase n=1 Tax=Cyclospora cayetanensis TaxID=88456 RepID=A0A6P6S3E5_9EIME|nr:uncharacterized protein LOC34619255 [Cyclospora cayetanensis]
MWGPQFDKGSFPRVPLGVQGGGSSMHKTGSGNSNSRRPSPSSQTSGPSRLAVAYRVVKHWVEDLLISDLNPTVNHVSRPSTASADAPVSLASAGCTTIPRESRRESKAGIASEFSHSSNSVIPLSHTHSQDVGAPPTTIPVSLSEGLCLCSSGPPWQVVPAYLSPRWPPARSHFGEARHGRSSDRLSPQQAVTCSMLEVYASPEIKEEPEYKPRVQDGRVSSIGHHELSPHAARAVGEVVLAKSSALTSPYVGKATAVAGFPANSTSTHSQQNGFRTGATRGSNGNVLRVEAVNIPDAGGGAPNGEKSCLQYNPFKVRWGNISTERSPQGRLRASSLYKSATDCDLSSAVEPRKAPYQAQQPVERQGPQFDIPLAGTEGNAQTSGGCTKMQGLQNADSLLWRMKDRLSSTSKTSGGSRTHLFKEPAEYPVRAHRAVDNVYRQETFPQKKDPRFHRHMTLVFKDPEVERSYGEFLRHARVKRLVIVGVLTILLNTMYDLPEWIITLSAPMLSSVGQTVGESDFSSVSNQLASRDLRSSLAWLLVFLDVIEVLLQVLLAASGYLPLLRNHTEITTVTIILSTSLLSSVRPSLVLLLHESEASSDGLHGQGLITPVQTIMTSTFLRSIVGSVLIDLVCLIRRRKLYHFHKLLSLLLLSLLVTCTVGGVQLGFPYSFFVFSWTVGLATGVVIAACHAGAYMSELMHRKAFHSVSAISAKLQRIEEENKSQRATGKNMLEQLVGLLKQMGISLSSIDPNSLEMPIRDTLLQVTALQSKCLGVLTSGRDMYAVNWLSPEVPPEMQVLYKKFIEPYVRQDSILAGAHDVQTVSAVNALRGRSRTDTSFPTGTCRVAITPRQQEGAHHEPTSEAAAFQPLDIPIHEGICLPEVESAYLTPNLGLADATAVACSTLWSLPTLAMKNTESKETTDTAPETHAEQGTTAQDNSENLHDVTNLQNQDSREDMRHTPVGHAKRRDAVTRSTVTVSGLRADIHSAVELTEGGCTPQASPLWGEYFAESDSAIEEALKCPSVSSTIGTIGTEWTIDMFALDRATNENCLVLVGLQLMLPHVRDGGLACSPSALYAFLKLLQDQYLPNLYHNRLHGAMVAHLSVMLSRIAGLSRTCQLRLGSPTEILLAAAPSTQTLTRGNTVSCKHVPSREERLLLPSTSSVTHLEASVASRKALDDELIMCIAALGHDVGHPGLNNAFLVSTNQSLALVYNDNAVLENYHSYITFKTISATAGVDGGILKVRQEKKQVIELILATDMAQHFPILSSFRARIASPAFSVSFNEEDRWMLAKLLIKTGDIGHSMLAWEQHYIWASRVNEEFCKQGDVEERLGLAISPLCDRRKAAELPAAQCGFLEYIVLPLATEIRSCLERQVGTPLAHARSASLEPISTALYLMDGVIAHANYNLRCWKSMTTPLTPQKQATAGPTEPVLVEKEHESLGRNANRRASTNSAAPDL